MAAQLFVSLLFLLVAHVFAVNSASASLAGGPVAADIITIPLDKQYVPVMREGTPIAYKTAYFGAIHVGLPAPQRFTVVFDTGSGHLLLPSISCTGASCKSHRRYDASLSSSHVDVDHSGFVVPAAVDNRDQVAIAFGTGEVLGEFVYETICLEEPLVPNSTEDVANAARLKETIPSHRGSVVAQRLARKLFGPQGAGRSCVTARVVLANEMTDDPFKIFDFDGVLGLGLDSLALDPEFSFFGQMVKNGRLPLAHFGVFISRDDASPSEISFGGHDARRIEGPLKWTPVNEPGLGYWQVRVNRIRVGDEILPYCEDGGCVGILDTGTSLLGVPKKAAQSLHWMLARKVPGQPSELDCRDWPGPSLVFELEGMEVSLSHEDYSRPAAIRVNNSQTNASHVICRASLLPVDMESALTAKAFILGEPLLRKYYTTYDWKEKRVGFAPAVQPALSSAPAAHRVTGAPPAGVLPRPADVTI